MLGIGFKSIVICHSYLPHAFKKIVAYHYIINNFLNLRVYISASCSWWCLPWSVWRCRPAWSSAEPCLPAPSSPASPVCSSHTHSTFSWCRTGETPHIETPHIETTHIHALVCSFAWCFSSLFILVIRKQQTNIMLSFLFNRHHFHHICKC